LFIFRVRKIYFEDKVVMVTEATKLVGSSAPSKLPVRHHAHFNLVGPHFVVRALVPDKTPEILELGRDFCSRDEHVLAGSAQGTNV
jgi:hypothetical protein